jgi:hypothetical protein
MSSPHSRGGKKFVDVRKKKLFKNKRERKKKK